MGGARAVELALGLYRQMDQDIQPILGQPNNDVNTTRWEWLHLIAFSMGGPELTDAGRWTLL